MKLKHKHKYLILGILGSIISTFLFVEGCSEAIFGFHWWQALIAITLILGAGSGFTITFHWFKKWCER